MNNDEKILKDLKIILDRLYLNVRNIEVVTERMDKQSKTLEVIQVDILIIKSKIAKISDIQNKIDQQSKQLEIQRMQLDAQSKQINEQNVQLKELNRQLELQQKQLKAYGTKIEIQSAQLDLRGNQIDNQGKLLDTLVSDVLNVVEEQQAQRLDVRSLHTEIHSSKDDLKAEILSSRAKTNADYADLKAILTKKK